MSKLLIILALIAVAVWWFRHRQLPPRETARPSPNGQETTMVRCDACQLFLPPSHATRHGGRWYCEKHRRDT